MPVPYWAGEFAYQWDQIWLGGQLFPGLARLSGPGIKRKLDVKNPKGAAGAGLTDEGDELARFDVKLKLWTEAQKDEFAALLPDIHPRRKGGPKTPLAIYHPIAAWLGIKDIYIDQIPIPEHDRTGVLIWTLKCIEWVPAPKPQKKGAGSKGSAAGAGKALSSAVDKSAYEELQDEIDEITETAQDVVDWIGSKPNTVWNSIADWDYP